MNCQRKRLRQRQSLIVLRLRWQIQKSTALKKTRLKIGGTPLNPLVDLLKVEHLDVDEDDRHRLLLVVPLRPERQPPDPVSHVRHPDRALGAQQSLSVQLVMLGARAISKSGDEMFSSYLVKTKFKEG